MISREPAPPWAHAEIARLRAALAAARAKVAEVQALLDAREHAWGSTVESLFNRRHRGPQA